MGNYFLDRRYFYILLMYHWYLIYVNCRILRFLLPPFWYFLQTNNKPKENCTTEKLVDVWHDVSEDKLVLLVVEPAELRDPTVQRHQALHIKRHSQYLYIQRYLYIMQKTKVHLGIVLYYKLCFPFLSIFLWPCLIYFVCLFAPSDCQCTCLIGCSLIFFLPYLSITSLL